MSRKPYECFRRRDNGFPGVQVYLAGKDNSGKTIYVEEDGTPHIHKQVQQEQQQQQTDYDKSVNDGISAISHITSLIRLAEQTQKLLVTMDGKLDHLTKLVYAVQQQKA